MVLLALLPLLMVMGCGKAKGTVKGTVLYKDAKGNEAPMPGGFITFVPTESGGRGGTFPINPNDGTFTAENITVGTMKVLVKSLDSAAGGGGSQGGGRGGGKPSGPPKSAKDKSQPPNSGGPPDEVKDKFDRSKTPGKYVPVNAKYQDLEKTPVQVTIEKGEQTLPPIKVD